MKKLKKRECRGSRQELEKDLAIGKIITEIFEKDIFPVVKDLNPRSITLNKFAARGEIFITLDITRLDKNQGVS